EYPAVILVSRLTECPTSRAVRNSGCGSSATIARSRRCFRESWACRGMIPAPRGFRFRRNCLTWQYKAYPIDTRSSIVELGMRAWPVDGADFLRIRLTARYGIMWKLRKPERLQLEINRMDGSRELKTFLVQPNVSSEVWFYPWSEPDLANYFDADETRRRTTPRPAITNLRIWT